MPLTTGRRLELDQKHCNSSRRWQRNALFTRCIPRTMAAKSLTQDIVVAQRQKSVEKCG